MFKFKIIQSENQETNNPFVELIANKMYPFQEKKSILKNPDLITLIITDAMEQDIIGGMALIKRDLSHLQEDIRRLIPTCTFAQNYIWECSTMYFIFSQDLSALPDQKDHFYRNFYRSLYEGLVKFGEQKGIGFLIAKLTADAYPPTKNFGLWPYILQFLPEEFPDDHFYGVLPLRGFLYETYKKNWEAFEKL